MLLPQLRSQHLAHFFHHGFDVIEMTVLSMLVWSYRDKVTIHAQSIVELDRKVVRVLSGSVQHVAITTSITISIALSTCMELSGCGESGLRKTGRVAKTARATSSPKMRASSPKMAQDRLKIAEDGPKIGPRSPKMMNF